MKSTTSAEISVVETDAIAIAFSASYSVGKAGAAKFWYSEALGIPMVALLSKYFTFSTWGHH